MLTNVNVFMVYYATSETKARHPLGATLESGSVITISLCADDHALHS